MGNDFLMIEINHVQRLGGSRTSFCLESSQEIAIEAQNLTYLPALIDPHVHFRTPGDEHKEDWKTGALAALAGGVTTVLDMPNTKPACTTQNHWQLKDQLIQKQLAEVNLPLRYLLYLGASAPDLHEIALLKKQIAALKIYMGSSTGPLLMADPAALKEAFTLAAEHNILVAVHAEDELALQRLSFSPQYPASIYSAWRDSKIATIAIEKAIDLAEQTGARLYLTHISSKSELNLIRQAKKKNLPIYAEATPHHLFLDITAYDRLGMQAIVNPPLRPKSDVQALWEAIHDGTIDTIGTDHAPHKIEEKMRAFPHQIAGFPSIEIYLALLLNAHAEELISLEKIESLTHTRPREIFNLPPHSDFVLVDLNLKKAVDQTTIYSKAGWSPYAGRKLQGWPRYTYCNGILFEIENL